ncbi:hypothetical protein HDZ31DRAFT_20199, partial [Schizophyllum fasciatum]
AGENGIVLAIDGSAPVAAAWGRIGPLIPHICKRISDCRPSYRTRIALVVYGPTHAPLLLYRFFADAQSVLLALTEAARHGCLSPHAPAATARDKTAALDALVAALDMFDALAASSQVASRPCLKHVIHIAAAPPDAACHPSTNTRPELDDLTWLTLPAAFREREIHYSSVQPARRDFGPLGEFQAKIATDPVKPWFPHDPSLLIRISGLTAPDPPPARTP